MSASRSAPRVRLTIGIDASRAFCAQPTGTERYATEVIRHLVAQNEHDYRLYARSRLTDPPSGVELVVLPMPRLWTHMRLAAEVMRRPPDLLFVPAHVLPWIVRSPSVVTVHDLGYLVFPEAHTRTQRWYLDRSTRRHVVRATRLIADSAATRADLLRFYRADPERVTVVHLAADDTLSPAPPHRIAALRHRLGWPADRRYVLHVGTLQPRKNLARLVTAFARIAGDDPDVSLVLAGKRGWGGEDLLALARSLGVERRVHLLGYVPRADLPALYGGAAAAVVPSLYEGFGLPVLEAMACGAPVATSNSSSLPEVAGEAALSFDPLDVDALAAALRTLLASEPLRTQLVAAGLARARRFSWARCARETQAVLEQAAREADEVSGQ